MSGTAPALFSGPSFRALEIVDEDLPALQRFFDENPEYFLAVGGERAGPDTAHEEFEDRPPAGWPWDGKWLIRFVDDAGAIVAVADVIANLLAKGVWHVGLFIVATRLHGSGAAHELYGALEAWARRGGAGWMRLNVVVGNARAERFWEKTGYFEVRRRGGVEIGQRVNVVRVMLKPLGDESLPAYLQRIPRDRAESP